MSNPLADARKLAYSVRFSEDLINTEFVANENIVIAAKNQFLYNELKISPDVTPSLFESLAQVCARLKIHISCIEAFVYPSPEVQAECYSGGEHTCVIRFSSALIDLLDEQEFLFVIGHELGHFLLRHTLVKSDESTDSIERFMQIRHQEISADRVGLISCGSLNVAIKALMKTVSGLKGHHLRFNVCSFISQINDSAWLANEKASHPSILIRCRALLWFSLSSEFLNDNFPVGHRIFDQLDKKISSDFIKYVDRSINNSINQAKNDIAMWKAVLVVLQGGIFTRSDQEEFSKTFGKNALSSIVQLLNDEPAHLVKALVNDRLVVAEKALLRVSPKGLFIENKKL